MTLTTFLFGKLNYKSFPFLYSPEAGTGIFIGLVGFIALIVIATVLYLTISKRWTWLWKEWLTTIDHKKIGVMYFIMAFIMLFRGFSDALLMRAQQAVAVGQNHGFLPPEHYDQIFTAHGVIMIFFVAMPLMFGLLNWVVPLQIGARDVAFPYMNSMSLWLTVSGVLLINVSLVIGDFAKTGWLAYPPLSSITYSPGVGVDYFIWGLQIAGIGSMLSGVNFFVTILRMRCPGLTLFRMPIFTWTALCASGLVVLAFPVLTVTLTLLFLDRFFDMHFFTMGYGGNAMMYINLIWIWGHPEVYILILPAFGVFSEVTATFCRKRLFGYHTMVWATLAITVLSFVVWLHHFFTMGSGASVNAFFGIATMVIAIPTGVKIFNWLFTMHQGRITFTTPMMWTIGFIATFSIGGMTGVLMSVPPVDFQLHNSLFLIAHFHNVIIGGVVFGYFAGFTYWFPKIFGFKLNERIGKFAFWFWLVGFYVAFMPLYVLGLMGMTRRLSHYAANTGWHVWLVIAACGALIVAAGIFCQVLQIVVSVKNRNKPEYRVGNDPWDARTTEWAIPSPAPYYNFAVTPTVNCIDSFWADKEKERNGEVLPKPVIKDVHMPKNTGVGFIIGAFSFFFGFGMIWHIYWMIFFGLIGMIAMVVARTFDSSVDYYIPAKEIVDIENSYKSEAVV
jgi:cytochrome o ubiquinol oxidase subunit 1